MASVKIAALAFCLMFFLGSALASEYAYGTKVLPGDSDVGNPLHILLAPNPVPFSIGYWETGVVAGYDDTDVVYLHQGPLAPPGVQANDVRLVPFGSLPAGSKVTPQDNDINKPLIALPVVLPNAAPVTIGWVNLYGSPSYDLNDPVYIHQGNVITPGGMLTTTNDVRLSAADNLEPGTKTHNFDPDLVKMFAQLPTANPPNPIATAVGGLLAPVAIVEYFDVNGNNQYDYPDDVYLHFPGVPPGAVTVNNVRLSGPVI